MLNNSYEGEANNKCDTGNGIQSQKSVHGKDVNYINKKIIEHNPYFLEYVEHFIKFSYQTACMHFDCFCTRRPQFILFSLGLVLTPLPRCYQIFYRELFWFLFCQKTQKILIRPKIYCVDTFS